MVFVAVDCEAYERDQHRVTEVGIAALDTRDLHGLPPGKDATAWGNKIKARHFRVQEHSHLTNTDFVQGCPDRFEFGETQWISLRNAARVVGACICSAAGAPDPAEPSSAADGGDDDDDMYQTGRNIVLVGQAVDNDIAYLEALGYVPRRVQRFIEGLDLGIIDREVKGLQQSRNLASILYDVNIVAWNLHNAGNDAVYTLQAMLALALRQKPKAKQEDEEEEEDDDDDDDSDDSDDDDEMEAWDGIPESVRQENERRHEERLQQQQAEDRLRAAASTEQVLGVDSFSDSDSQSDGGVPLPADIATSMPMGDSDSASSPPGSPTATRSTSTANNNNNNNNSKNNSNSKGSKNDSKNTNTTGKTDDKKDFW